MYERSAIVLERYFEKLFGFEKENNLKLNFNNYKDLIGEIKKYQEVLSEEEIIIKEFEKTANIIQDLQSKQEKLHREALAKAEQIEKLGSIELSAKAGESGKLFGTITTKKLCEELKERAGIEVDRKAVSLNAPINRIGEFTMLIKLTSKVKSELKVIVTASEVVKESVEEVEETEA